jgi:diguanylate cyclase
VRLEALSGNRISRLFVIYAVVCAIPVLALGFILAAGFRADARERGLAQARTEAGMVASSAVDPILDGRSLSAGLTRRETAALARLVDRVRHGNVLRLRLRDPAGRVVFGSSDGGGIDPGAAAAAAGRTTAELTHVDGDGGRAAGGPRAVEVYLPLRAASGGPVLGELELYLGYAPIDHDLAGLLSILYRDLALGLGGLYLVLFGITASVCSRLRREADHTAFLAGHDVLTGLANRGAFAREAGPVLARAAAAGRSAAIAVIDLDRFKAINDTLGHPTGDHVLRELAARLTETLGAGAHVARLGGDEFAIVLGDGRSAPTALCTLRTALDHEITVAGLTLAVSSSIGYALAPDDGADVDVLLQRAEVAMYAAKGAHTGIERYAPALDRHDAESLALLAELPHAIEDDQLVLHYQPQIQLRTGRVISIEALVRWQHPVHGLLFPDRFLPLAEQTDVIESLTAWVLRRALRDVLRLSPERGGPRVAVNVSARSLGRGALAGEVLDALAELGADPDRLVIEVTETAILADPERAAAELGRLAAAGVRISLDDFGRGQTSLGHLSALPLHELKIDRSFVGDMDSDPVHGAIVRSLIELGRNLGLQVVAEGVETGPVRGELYSAGVDIIQGYLLSRPQPALEISEWLTAHDRERRAMARCAQDVMVKTTRAR